jgi:hypothetical protein
MITSSKKLLYITLMGFCLLSCKKLDSYLDKAEAGGRTVDEIFGQFVLAEGFLSNVYAGLPSEYDRKYTAATDESKSLLSTGAIENRLLIGDFSPSSNPYDVWAVMYQGIRKANIFLQNVDRIPATDAEQEQQKPRMKGEAMFLRAFFYAELHKRYGGVPIVKDLLDINGDIKLPKNTEVEVADFIQSECTAAAALLPVSYSAINLGRATKGAALALKSRVLLYSASLLHNPTGTKEKWKAAADASKEVMDLQTYSLDANYKLLFHKRISPEIIFQHTVNYTTFTSQLIAFSLGGTMVYYVPTQNLVDDYEMTNGIKPVASYNPDGTPNVNPGSGYNPANPYLNRDPRFYMSVLYNGSTWRQSTIFTHVGAPNNGIDAKSNPAATGYYTAKMLDQTASVSPTVINGSNYWIYFRYAEVLLNYAESLNEYLDAPDINVYNAVNTVRGRTGVAMPALPGGLNKDQMRERIRQERRIELAFEGHRYWDMKRWRISTDIMKEAYGMKITKNPDASYSYQRILVDTRSYLPKYDLFPIPQSEINKNPNLIQNPGY